MGIGAPQRLNVRVQNTGRVMRAVRNQEAGERRLFSPTPKPMVELVESFSMSDDSERTRGGNAGIRHARRRPVVCTEEMVCMGQWQSARKVPMAAFQFKNEACGNRKRLYRGASAAKIAYRPVLNGSAGVTVSRPSPGAVFPSAALARCSVGWCSLEG